MLVHFSDWPLQMEKVLAGFILSSSFNSSISKLLNINLARTM